MSPGPPCPAPGGGLREGVYGVPAMSAAARNSKRRSKYGAESKIIDGLA